jgi:glutathione S-transferase
MLTILGASASPFVRKVRVVLEEKGVPYEVDPVIPFNVSEEFKKISPLGKIPAMRDGDKTISDSSVISAYLERTHPTPPLYPSDAFEYARALWFEEYSDSALVNVIGGKIFFPRVVAPLFLNQKPNEEEVQKAIDEELPPLLSYLEVQLGEKKFFAGGAFSIADIAVASPFANLSYAGVSIDAARWPKLARHVAAAHERPSFKKLLAEDKAAFAATA